MNQSVFNILSEEGVFNYDLYNPMMIGINITFSVNPDFYNSMPMEVRRFLIKNRRSSLNLPMYAKSNVDFCLSDSDFNLLNETMAYELGHS